MLTAPFNPGLIVPLGAGGQFRPYLRRTRGGGGFTDPTSIAGLKLWLAASAIGGLSDGDPVATWADASGLANDATQATGTNQPLYKTGIVNSLPVVRFVRSAVSDSLSHWLDLPDLMSGASAGTAFLVAKVVSEAVANDGALAQFGTDGNSDHWPYLDGNIYDGFGSTARKTVGNPTPDLTTAFRRFCVISAASDYRFYVDNGSLHSTATNTVGWGTTPRLGNDTRAATGTWGGDMAEVVIYDSALSDADRNNVDAYLTTKYGL